MMSRRIAALAWVLLGALVGAAIVWMGPSVLRTGSDELPMNFVALTERLATSGQPSREQLQGLHEQGYDIVINLAPPDSPDSIRDEGAVVAETGLAYLNIPVDWSDPKESDFQLFSAVLQANPDGKALVHCQINLRASVFGFLYRVIYEGAPIDEAIEDVHAIWVPSENWQLFMRETLSRHGISVEF